MTEVFLCDGAPCNVMKDLETWGTWAGCAVRSIGAVMFDPYGEGHGAEFYANITDQSCLDAGLVQDPKTVAWWAQPKHARAAEVFAKDQLPLREVGEAFNEWVRKNKGIFMWSQGANFDQPIWEAALRAVGLEPTWKFWDSRCTRTAYDMGRINHHAIRRVGVHHYALDDAKHQVKCVQAAYRRRG